MMYSVLVFLGRKGLDPLQRVTANWENHTSVFQEKIFLNT